MGNETYICEMTKQAEAKPCPFCGGKAELLSDSDGSFYLDVYHFHGCFFDHNDTSRWYYDCTPEEAVEEWNRRAQ